MKISLRLTKVSLLLPTLFLLTMLSLPRTCVAAEHSLGGIKIFNPISVVLKKFGDPTLIAPTTSVVPVDYDIEYPILASSGGNNSSYTMPENSDTGTNLSSLAAAHDPFDTLYDRGSRYYFSSPKRGLIFEFVTTTAGRVIGEKVYGYHSQIRTSLGIGLGSTYAEILLKYGYPDQTSNVASPDGNDMLTLSYVQHDNVVFRLIRNRVAAISVVAPD
jgi:hypothetical protein